MSIAHATADEHRFLRVSLAAPPDPRWAEDMTNELNYIPQNRDGILRELLLSFSLSFYACAYARVSERGASSRETRSSGNLVLSFLSSPMVVHRLLIRFIFNSAERKAIVRGHDSS